jgi:hypothetical protein
LAMPQHHRREPLKKRFSKSDGYGADDQLAAFWKMYFDDPKLRSPVGRWAIRASAGFYLGGCGGREVRQGTSVPIEVE